MNKIQELAQQLEAENSALLQAVEKGKADNKKKSEQLSKREIELDKKELELVEKEKALTAREEETRLRWDKIRRDDEVKAQYEEVIQKEERLKLEAKKNAEALDEVNYKLAKVQRKELEVAEKIRTYKEEIKKEFAESILGGK